uniref:F-box/kelch-repeat protein At3g06240-like n=1 Tax=Erigeron canadensis TaxID=72917 RepID=UPI001CB9956F|nr:F-box/kelch-repeat protein At3g06240-like [Erigeron canadensis]
MSNAFINGNIHRLATKGSDNQPKIIVAFSLADETISEVPSLDDYIMRPGPCELVDVGGKLGIFREYDGVVWLMNEYGVKESWTKILCQEIPRGVDRLALIHKDDGKILVVYRKLKLIYTLDKKGLRKYCDAKSRLWKDLIPKAICVESLVSLHNYGQVHQLARIFDNPS